MKVLIIDTDQVISDNLAHILQARSCEVKQVTNAQDGLDELDHFGPDAVILDTQLGPHNGIEFIYEMRSHADMDAVPVFVYSTNRNVLDERFQPAWTMAKARVYFKPATPPKLLAMHVLKETA